MRFWPLQRKRTERKQSHNQKERGKIVPNQQSKKTKKNNRKQHPKAVKKERSTIVPNQQRM
jgi:hypothetical protein